MSAVWMDHQPQTLPHPTPALFILQSYTIHIALILHSYSIRDPRMLHSLILHPYCITTAPSPAHTPLVHNLCCTYIALMLHPYSTHAALIQHSYSTWCGGGGVASIIPPVAATVLFTRSPIGVLAGLCGGENQHPITIVGMTSNGYEYE